MCQDFSFPNIFHIPYVTLGLCFERGYCMSQYLKSTEASYTRGILYEYTKVLTGEMAGFSSATLGRKSPKSQKNAMIICRLAFEIFLRWTPEDVAGRLTKTILDELKLTDVLPYLELPADYFTSGDYTLLAAAIYPGKLSVSENTLVINTYKMVLLGKDDGGLYRFPKKYFDGNIGMKRAAICFRYMMSTNTFFHSTKEMYEFFASPAGSHLINSQGLKLVLRDIYHSPVRFLHESLPEEERDNYWYHYYEFLYHYGKEKRNYDQYQKTLNNAKK